MRTILNRALAILLLAIAGNLSDTITTGLNQASAFSPLAVQEDCCCPPLEVGPRWDVVEFQGQGPVEVGTITIQQVMPGGQLICEFLSPTGAASWTMFTPTADPCVWRWIDDTGYTGDLWCDFLQDPCVWQWWNEDTGMTGELRRINRLNELGGG